MKTSILSFGILLALSMVFGCGTTKTIDPNYQAYQQAIMNQPPLVHITWTDDGQRMKDFKVNPQINIQQKAPDAPHPFWNLATGIVKGLTIVGGIVASGDAVSDVISAGNGATSIANSYNQPGGHMASGNVEVPTTTTTTTNTETITGTDAALPE